MPFIRGRYHINAIAGQALQAAREAEEAASLEHGPASGGDEVEAEDEGNGDGSQRANRGPIHRVEIETAELVPAHSGRAQRGFVAHVHREATQPTGSDDTDSAESTSDNSPYSRGQGTRIASLRSPRPGQLPSAGYARTPETHAFADHRDLVNFLRDEFAKQCKEK